jgi:uncharacterized protein (DUF111 family)
VKVHLKVRELFIDCEMGATKDMLLAGLMSLVDDKRETLRELNGLGLHGATYELTKTELGGVQGCSVTIACGEEHAHAEAHTSVSAEEVRDIIAKTRLPARALENALETYNLLAKAEAHVHGQTVETVHFHEVGNTEAIASVVGVCFVMDRLNIGSCRTTPINVGGGFVKCAHGTLAVPTPATAYILKESTTYSSKYDAELVTPTSGALIVHFAGYFKQASKPSSELRTGYGISTNPCAENHYVKMSLHAID